MARKFGLRKMSVDALLAAKDIDIVYVVTPNALHAEEVIAAANERNMAMIFTGTRHFRH